MSSDLFSTLHITFIFLYSTWTWYFYISFTILQKIKKIKKNKIYIYIYIEKHPNCLQPIKFDIIKNDFQLHRIKLMYMVLINIFIVVELISVAVISCLYAIISCQRSIIIIKKY
jgi:hypothetical protein